MIMANKEDLGDEDIGCGDGGGGAVVVLIWMRVHLIAPPLYLPVLLSSRLITQLHPNHYDYYRITTVCSSDWLYACLWT